MVAAMAAYSVAVMVVYLVAVKADYLVDYLTAMTEIPWVETMETSLVFLLVHHLAFRLVVLKVEMLANNLEN